MKMEEKRQELDGVEWSKAHVTLAATRHREH